MTSLTPTVDTLTTELRTLFATMRAPSAIRQRRERPNGCPAAKGVMQMKLLSSAACASLILSTPAFADFTGVTIGVSCATGNGPSPEAWSVWSPEQAVTVGPGVEWQYESWMNLDFSASSIRVTYTSPWDVFWPSSFDFTGFIFRDLNDALPDFTGISLGQFVGNSWGPVVASVHDPDTLLINFARPGQGLSFPDGDFGVFEVLFIPAPGALVLLGLAGIMQSRRRRDALRSPPWPTTETRP
jgi:hypothetical protein